jgi:hypothetical protein
MFSTHKEMDGEYLYMKNSTSKVLDIGKDLLKMTYKKKLALNYMLHIAHIRMNLMFGSIINLSLRVINLYSLRIKCAYERSILVMTS